MTQNSIIPINLLLPFTPSLRHIGVDLKSASNCVANHLTVILSFLHIKWQEFELQLMYLKWKGCWPQMKTTNNAKSMDWKTTFRSILFALSSCHAPSLSTLTADTHLRLACHDVFASSVASSVASSIIPSSSRPSLCLRFVRHHVFASSVVSSAVPSLSRPSLCLRFACRCVFASPVASSVVSSMSRPSLCLRIARQHVINPGIVVKLWYRCILLCLLFV